MKLLTKSLTIVLMLSIVILYPSQAQTKLTRYVNTFIGTVRNKSTGRPVVRLEYEAYDSMALHQLRKVAEQAQERWPMLQKVTVIHRKGTLYIGDVAVIVAVSTPHRAESFAACQYIIDTLKQVVTIWKKEFYEDGDVWVAAHP